MKMWAIILVVILGTAVLVSGARSSGREARDQRKTADYLVGQRYSLSGGEYRFSAPRGLAYFVPWDGYACATASGLQYSLVQGIAFLDGYRLPPPDLPRTVNRESIKLPPSPVPDHPVPPTKIKEGNPNRPRVALTFDSDTVREPSAGRLINILIQQDIPATLFICGAWAHANPDYLQIATEAGLEIASHSYWHPWMTRILPEHVVIELTETGRAVQDISGKPIAAYFRPPFGDVNQSLVDLAGSCGFYTIMWTRDTRDWDSATIPEDIIRRATEGIQNGDIILMHTNGIHTLGVLAQVAHILRAKGFELTTVTGVLEP